MKCPNRYRQKKMHKGIVNLGKKILGKPIIRKEVLK